jgi:hypothetical protein
MYFLGDQLFIASSLEQSDFGEDLKLLHGGPGNNVSVELATEMEYNRVARARSKLCAELKRPACAPEPIDGQSCCTTRHDTNTTKHDTIRHEHGWTRLPFVSCRVRRRAKTSTRTLHEGHRVVPCWHDNTTGPPCRVNTNTIHRKKFH